MIIFIILIHMKSGALLNSERIFDNKAKCEAYATYRNVESEDKAYCAEFKQVGAKDGK